MTSMEQSRQLTLSLSAWRHLENLAARTGLSLEQVLQGTTDRPHLLDAIAAALTTPIEVHEFLTYRLAPDRPVSSLIAGITVNGDTIQVRSEWNQTMIETVKSLRYRWNETQTIWYRQITSLSATLTDRLVELGVHLLAAGVIIETPNQELADRIIAGDYRPERRHWVAVSRLDRYAGWFYIFWPPGEPYRGAAQRITGARLFRSSAAVPATAFDEVLDFADRHGFAVSDKALTLAAKAQAERDAMFIANPKPKLPPPPASAPIASISDDTGILPDLADYD